MQSQLTTCQDLVKIFGQRALHHDIEKSITGEGAELEAYVTNRAHALMADWAKIVLEKTQEGVGLNYQKYEDTGSQSPLLRDFLDSDLQFLKPIYSRFRANRSMRDVEPAVDILSKPSTSGTNA